MRYWYAVFWGGRKHAVAALAAGAGLAASAAGGATAAFCTFASLSCPPPSPLQLRIDEVRVSPRKMPAQRRVPSAVRAGARIWTHDGSHPPALREGTLRVDRSFAIDAVGLPVCKTGGRDIVRSREEVLKMCRAAIVGAGTASIQLAFPGRAPIPAKVKVTLFNGGIDDGVTTLFAYAMVPIPIPRPAVATVRIEREAKGPFGWLAKVDMPVIAGGDGSLLGFDFSLRRRFFDADKRKSFLWAKCPRGDLRFEVARAVFENESNAPGWAPRTVFRSDLIVPCTPLG